MQYVALDLETTGLDPERDGVIEAGAVAFDVERVGDRFERFANPGRRIPEVVSRLTGISNEDLRGAPPQQTVLAELAAFIGRSTPVGHGAGLDVDFLRSAGCWEPGQEILDTLHVARILIPEAASHSLPLLAAELGLDQPRPHRALDDADATRQLLLHLRERAIGLDEELKEKMLALVAPYGWPVARFFAEALSAMAPVQAGDGVERGPGPRLRIARAPVELDDSDAALVALLGPEGPLAAALPEYEHREGQLQMLLAVGQIQRRGGRLVVEAGTGTGKSLAYLIPSIARALRHGERVVVSTATHTLQEQLIQKDLPALRSWMPWDFEVCLLKGRANYLSLRRWRRYLAEPCADSEELRFKLKVMVWLDRTGTGDRSELRLQGREEALWARVASDRLDCVGVHCRAEDCFVHRARAEAELADVVVVNHALLLADAQTGGGVLPDFNHLVIDEAHHLEDAATQGLRQEVDGPAVLALADRLLAEAAGRRTGLVQEILLRPRLGDGEVERELAAAGPLVLRARERFDAFFEAVGGWTRAVLSDPGRRDENVRLVAQVRQEPGFARLAELAGDAVTAAAALDAALRRAVAAGRDWLGGEEPDQDLRELEIIRGRLAEVAGIVQLAIREPDPNFVYWLTLIARTSTVVLRAAPLEVGGLLREHVYGPRDSVVFTSASLAVGGSFDYFRSRAGVGEEAETLLIASPFDYLEQALVCLPTDVPEPQSPDYESVLVELLADVGARIGGRTLALFTSHQQLRDVYWRLRHRHDLDRVLLLGQGIDGQRRQVLRSFVEAPHAMLLGTSSFWEGIDVPGDRLSCVVVVRLPFPVPTEPVFAARSELVRDSFANYALPLAALRLKQGFGRLIRRSTDRGAVVILDPRILTREYGRAFLEVLPPASEFRGPVAEAGRRIQGWLSPEGARAT